MGGDVNTTWLPRVLLFTDKSSTTAMYKSLALNMRNRMVVGQVRVSDGNTEAVKAQFEKHLPGLFDTGYPKLVVVNEEGRFVKYDGKLSFPSVLEFFRKFAVPNPDEVNHYMVLGVAPDAEDDVIKRAYRKLSLKYHPDKNTGNPKAKKSFEAVASAYEVLSDENARALYDGELDAERGGESDADFYRRNKDVTNVEGFGHFQQLMSQGGSWLIEYYTPWCEPCQKFSSEFKKLPAVLEGLNVDKKVRLAAVNCVKQQQTCAQLGVQSYPTVRMYNSRDGGSDGGFEHYQGRLTAQAVAQWTADSLDSAVVEIANARQFKHQVDGSNQLWIVDFYSPRCGPCQAIKGDVRRIANQMKGLAKVGMFNCAESSEHQQFCHQQKGIKSYPTVMAFSRLPGLKGKPKRGVELEVTGQKHGAIEAMQVATQILRMNSEDANKDAPETDWWEVGRVGKPLRRCALQSVGGRAVFFPGLRDHGGIHLRASEASGPGDCGCRQCVVQARYPDSRSRRLREQCGAPRATGTRCCPGKCDSLRLRETVR